MKRTITLSEKDLSRLVLRVIEESKKDLLKEGKQSVDKWVLYQTYKKYNNLGSKGTFNEIFEPEIKSKKQPFVSFSNGCATKVSLALAAAGQKVHAAFVTTSGEQKGTPIQTSAVGLKDNLTELWGKPNTYKGSFTEQQLLNKIGENKTGIIICAPCGFGPGVSGHATVWSRNHGTNEKGGTADDTVYHLNNPNAVIHFWKVGDDNK
jgi:hypothetical protein